MSRHSYIMPHPGTTPCRWLPGHRWELRAETQINRYYECPRCEARRVQSEAAGYQPIDWAWLEHRK